MHDEAVTQLSPMALEVAKLYMELPPDRRAALYAVAEAMHNPTGSREPQGREAGAAAQPTMRRVPYR